MPAKPIPNLNKLALRLKSLHTPTSPLILLNVHDAATANAIAQLPSTTAIATASYSIANSLGFADNSLTLADNVFAIRSVRRGIKLAGKEEVLPLSADVQDGYEDVANTVRAVVAEGVVGVNLEDTDNKFDPPKLRSVEDAVSRIKSALSAARDAGVPDFVVNARTDLFGYEGKVEDVIERGKRFLEAGATTVFVWGVGKKGITVEEVKQMAQALGGRLAVQPGVIGMEGVVGLGASRVSIGPTLFLSGVKAQREEAGRLEGLALSKK